MSNLEMPKRSGGRRDFARRGLRRADMERALGRLLPEFGPLQPRSAPIALAEWIEEPVH